MISDACSSDTEISCLGMSSYDSLGSHAYILGETFLRAYYAIFDESLYRVGFGSMYNDSIINGLQRPMDDLDDSQPFYETTEFIVTVVCIIILIIASCFGLYLYNKHKQKQVSIDKQPMLNSNDYIAPTAQNDTQFD